MLSRDEYRSHDAVGLAALVQAGEITPHEVLESAIAEMDRLNPRLNAVVMRNDEKAHIDAGSLDLTLSLSGVPFPAKDVNVNVAGFQTTHACRFFSGSPVHDVDSLLVQRWRKAGLVIPARTNTPEFATDYGCEPELFGPTYNPWDLRLTPGGSSGGAAVAVASGMFPMAHASDSGGSIRVPAACCGVLGFKPSSGLVATGSSLGALVGGLNCDHAVSWTVRDSATLLDATVGSECGAAQPFVHSSGSFLSILDRPLRSLHIGVCVTSPTGLSPRKEIAEKLEITVKLLEELGHKVRSWNWPADADPYDVAGIFWMAELAAVIENHAEQIGRKPQDGDLGPLVRWSMEQAHANDSVVVAIARKRLRKLQVAMATATADIDILLTPVVAEAPLETGVLTELVNKSIDEWAERAWRFAPYPEIFNVTGQPAMSVPLHQSENGLPIGMHFAAGVGKDALLLRLARQLEDAMPWHARRPPEVV